MTRCPVDGLLSNLDVATRVIGSSIRMFKLDRDFSYKAAIFFLLMAIWVVFSGQFDAFHLTLGVISSLLVVGFSGDLLFSDRSKGLEVRFRQAIRLILYVVWLVYEIILANLHVLRLALHPKGTEEVKPEVLSIPVETA